MARTARRPAATPGAGRRRARARATRRACSRRFRRRRRSGPAPAGGPRGRPRLRRCPGRGGTAIRGWPRSRGRSGGRSGPRSGPRRPRPSAGSRRAAASRPSATARSRRAASRPSPSRSLRLRGRRSACSGSRGSSRLSLARSWVCGTSSVAQPARARAPALWTHVGDRALHNRHPPHVPKGLWVSRAPARPGATRRRARPAGRRRPGPAPCAPPRASGRDGRDGR